MRFEGEVLIPAGASVVWLFLSNPHKLGECVPGLNSLTVIEPDKTFASTVHVKLGGNPVKLPVQLEWERDENEQKGQLVAQVQYGGQWVECRGEMSLKAIDDKQTNLVWFTHVILPEGMRQNRFTMRLMQNVATRFLKQFFTCVKQEAGGLGD